MKSIVIFLLSIVLYPHTRNGGELVKTIGPGQMPAVAKNKNIIGLVYGIGDSLLLRTSANNGATFGNATLIALLPGLNASATRGPQLVPANNGFAVIATTEAGSIFSFVQNDNGKWMPPVKVNDVDSVNLEGFISLASDGNGNLYSAWPDLRNDKRNKLYGAGSTDGGKTWTKNKMIYTSPDSSICECCKQTVVMNGKNIHVMFRNWLNGNRDLYLIHSADLGNNFTSPEKLGLQSWALNGCPMDGGMLILDDKKNPQTIWNRRGTVYTCEPGREEHALGEGRSCTMENINGIKLYAWVENKQVLVIDEKGTKTILGEGKLPVLKALNKTSAICVWENEKQIQYAVVDIRQ